jgi:hypothetical protein
LAALSHPTPRCYPKKRARAKTQARARARARTRARAASDALKELAQVWRALAVPAHA